jgi:hypothetical protein
VFATAHKNATRLGNIVGDLDPLAVHESITVLLLESLEEWDEKPLFLRRDFDVIQDDIGQFIQAAE